MLNYNRISTELYRTSALVASEFILINVITASGTGIYNDLAKLLTESFLVRFPFNKNQHKMYLKVHVNLNKYFMTIHINHTQSRALKTVCLV